MQTGRVDNPAAINEVADAVETGNPEAVLRNVWNTVQEVYVPEPKTAENATRVTEAILQRDGARGVMDRVKAAASRA